MGWKIVLSFLFVVLVVVLLMGYWFIPLDTTEFTNSGNSNFSLSSYGKENMQFYENMRYKDKKITYTIFDCPLAKEDEMIDAFKMISEQTVLDFFSTSKEPEISVTCDSSNKIEDGLFIAGEGGPINITSAGNFNVIFKGKILLIRESGCQDPNIALHELLHALGFDHSTNKNNIMYPVSKCGQTIGDDILDLIDEIYAVRGYPDLSLQNVSAAMKGKYLNTDFTIRNNGLENIGRFKVNIYADDKLVKEMDFDGLDIGYGREIKLTNVWVMKSSVDELRFVIESNLQELEKDNNQVVLKIK